MADTGTFGRHQVTLGTGAASIDLENLWESWETDACGKPSRTEEET